MEPVKYHAIALDDNYVGGRRSGELTLETGSVVFRHSEGVITWPLNEVEFSRGGAGNALVYIKHRTIATPTLYTSDKKIIKDTALQGNYATRDNIRVLRAGHQRSRLITLAVVLLLLSPLALIFTFRSSIVSSIADHIPVSYEQKVGDNLFTLVSSGYKIIEDTTLNQHFNNMVAPLVKQVSDTTHHFDFYMISDTTVNAFALPGGKVVVNSGLILKSDQWSEIQGVLAHEIAHVTLRHHVRGVINQQGLFFLISALVGGYSDMVATLAGYGSHLESLMYSRKFEFEADNRAVDYLQQAGVDANGMISFFEKLQKAHPEDITSGFTKIMSTHPPTGERIDNLKSRIQAYTPASQPEPAIDIKSFQQLLQKQL
ncbi:peptidase M48-like protein [Breznakibacter xylanolyticus]|uniref:Peptidase M48-like protein n=1 Tax=Breznakibacter xylanolyticus TaxID=990 RepID=A0A2W7N0T6_9BACT|nr:M48 family metallopeptidase [Breznakibacter xylanolyticus]PZX13690.1 peptidase M48-like protein [Breznakibacter xylanolyticus]